MSTPRRVLAIAGTFIASAALAAPASAALTAVNDGVANWQTARNYSPSTARTYFGYVLNSGDPARGASNGTVSSSFGAEIIKPGGARSASVTHTDTPAPDPTSLWTFEYDVTGGTVDPVARRVNVNATGTISFSGHNGAMTMNIANPRIVVNSDGTGGVYASGDDGSSTKIDPTKPLFTLNTSQATFAQAGNTVVVDGLVPTMGEVEYFGASYRSGVSGPDRNPNTFGGFSLVLGTAPLGVTEKAVETKVFTKLPIIRTTLDRRPFGKTAVHVEIRKAGSKTVIGSGFVVNRGLTVWLDDGSKLEGKYTLDRKSGSKRLKKKAFVTLGEKTAGKNKSSKKSKK